MAKIPMTDFYSGARTWIEESEMVRQSVNVEGKPMLTYKVGNGRENLIVPVEAIPVGVPVADPTS